MMDKETKLILYVLGASVLFIGGAWYYNKMQKDKAAANLTKASGCKKQLSEKLQTVRLTPDAVSSFSDQFMSDCMSK